MFTLLFDNVLAKGELKLIRHCNLVLIDVLVIVVVVVAFVNL